MAQERPNRIAEWFSAARAHLPHARRSAAEWLERIREEPQLLWAAPAVRYAVYGLGAVLAAWVITFVVGLLAPAPPPAARPQATTADYHVICANPDCAHHFVIRREFGFDDFPVECTRCKEATGHAARLCNSPTCRGRWVVPAARAEGAACPHCGTAFK